MSKLASLPIAEYMKLDESSPTGLTWIKYPGGRYGEVGTPALAGTDKLGYHRGKFKGVPLLAHRVVFFLAYGYEPKCVDHIDRNPANNLPSNLRAATHQQNSFNTLANRDNRVGYKGVTKVGSKYRAVLCYKGKNIYLGAFPTPEQAHAAYTLKAKELHGDFYNSGN